MLMAKDIKEFLEANIGVDKMQQRLMFEGTELKTVNQERPGASIQFLIVFTGWCSVASHCTTSR
eukprot:SAG25_NODE_1706_length_2507_cov_2.964286_4_plen_64_part_00